MVLRDLLRLPVGEPVDLSSYSSASIAPGGPSDKAAGVEATTLMAPDLADLQERLYAASTAGDRRRLLLVLQGMDTSGKGGTVKHVIGLFNPSGCRIRAFKAPTEEERAHSFLWRIAKALPEAGEIGIFDRSHYEDVLIGRVRGLAPPEEIERRYDHINNFEQSLAESGVTVVKVFLHVGHDRQKRRLLERLDNPDKHWKFDPADIEDRVPVARVPGGVRARTPALFLARLPLVPGPRRPQVVPQLGGEQPPARTSGGAGPAVPEGRLRRGGVQAAAAGEPLTGGEGARGTGPYGVGRTTSRARSSG